MVALHVQFLLFVNVSLLFPRLDKGVVSFYLGDTGGSQNYGFINTGTYKYATSGPSKSTISYNNTNNNIININSTLKKNKANLSIPLSATTLRSNSSSDSRSVNGNSSSDNNDDLVVSLFPGQGSQHIGMGKDTIDRYPELMEYYDEASALLGYDLYKTINTIGSNIDGTDIAQPAIFVSSIVALNAYLKDNPNNHINVYGDSNSIPGTIRAKPSSTPRSASLAPPPLNRLAMGLSLGEYSALCMGGSLDFSDGVRITDARGKAMQQASDDTKGGMISVIGLDKHRVHELADHVNEWLSENPDEISEERGGNGSDEERVYVSNYLCNGNYVVSGSRRGIDRIAVIGKKHFKARMCVKLNVAGAFHTKYMGSALSKLENILSKVKFKDASVNVISNVDGSWHDDSRNIKDRLIKQVVSPVQWELSMNNVIDKGMTKGYEFGPANVLQGLFKRAKPSIQITNVH